MTTVAQELRDLTPDNLFHLLWTKAVGTTDYIKAEWLELERRLALVFFRAPGRTLEGYLDVRLSPVAVERWQAGRSDTLMARVSGFSTKYWGVLRRGEAKDPPLSTCVRMCQALGCSISDLLEVVPGSVRHGVGVTQLGHGDPGGLAEPVSALETGAPDFVVDQLGEVVGIDLDQAGQRRDGATRDLTLGVADTGPDGVSRGANRIAGGVKAHGGDTTRESGGVKPA